MKGDGAEVLVADDNAAIRANLALLLRSEGYAVVGSPDSVVNRLRELHDELGFGQLIGLFALGDIPHERTTRSMDSRWWSLASSPTGLCRSSSR